MPHNTPGDVHVPRPMGAQRAQQGEPSALEDGIREEMEEHGIDRATAEKLARDHLKKDPEYYSKSSRSPEYLSAYYESARKVLQGWQHDQIHALAFPSAGGATGRRKPEHTELERALLKKLEPAHIKDMDDATLTKTWGELENWHKLASRKRLDTEDYERAATFIADELERRKTVQIDPQSHLAQVVMAKAAGLVLPEIAIAAAPAGVEPIAKAWREKQIIWYAMGVPGEVDTYEHQITREEVEDACHRYMLNGCVICIEHGEAVGLNAMKRFPKVLSPNFAVCVECGLTLSPTTEVFGQHLARPLPEGTWYTANHYKNVELWELLKNTPHGGSWRGYARKRES